MAGLSDGVLTSRCTRCARACRRLRILRATSQSLFAATRLVPIERELPGIAQEELRALGSIILRSADKTRVPAGQALAVDRGFFASGVTKQLEAVGKIKVVREEVVRVPQGAIVIIATGPLTSSAFSEEISSLLGRGHLHFFDAVAPIISGYSVDWSRVYWASRYGKGDADYANCAMNEEEYHAFYESLVQAETAEMHEFES